MEKKIYRIIQEGNDKICDFMSVVFHDDKGKYYDSNGLYIGVTLKYHKNWNWLMPVISKISSNCEEPEELDDLKYALLCDDIETAWRFVVDYLD